MSPARTTDRAVRAPQPSSFSDGGPAYTAAVAPHPPETRQSAAVAEAAFDAATCIGCGAFVAACPGGSVALFPGAKTASFRACTALCGGGGIPGKPMRAAPDTCHASLASRSERPGSRLPALGLLPQTGADKIGDRSVVRRGTGSPTCSGSG